MAVRPADDVRLETAYSRYERALLDGERVEVSSARLTLCRLLAATGWTLPRDVHDQMDRDERTLRGLAEKAGMQPPDLLRVPSHRSPWVERDQPRRWTVAT